MGTDSFDIQKWDILEGRQSWVPSSDAVQLLEVEFQDIPRLWLLVPVAPTALPVVQLWLLVPVAPTALPVVQGRANLCAAVKGFADVIKVPRHPHTGRSSG